jgi:hypothetical protein
MPTSSGAEEMAGSGYAAMKASVSAKPSDLNGVRMLTSTEESTDLDVFETRSAMAARSCLMKVV